MGGKILIADGSATTRILMRVKLSANWHATVMAESAGAALSILRNERPDLVVVGTVLRDATGPEFLRALRAEPGMDAVPVLALTPDPGRRARCALLEAGADDVMSRPIDETLLLARIRSLLRRRDSDGARALAGAAEAALGMAEPAAAYCAAPQGAARVALVTDRPETGLAWRRALSPFLPARYTPVPRAELFAADQEAALPDVFLIDAGDAAGGAALSLLSELHSRPETRAIRCVVVCEPGRAAMALDLGAAACLEAPLDPEPAALILRRLIGQKRDADQRDRLLRDGLALAVIDPLTGLHNRRFGLSALAERVATLPPDRQLAVMLIDIDRFKAVNDTWGHGAGDIVLGRVARRLAAALPAGALLSRIGGEEFLAAASLPSAADARAIADRLIAAVRDTQIALSPPPEGAARSPEEARLRVTVSLGLAIACNPAGPDAAQRLVQEADRALMTAKLRGRDCFTVASGVA